MQVIFEIQETQTLLPKHINI